jgi:hypothetical protein
MDLCLGWLPQLSRDLLCVTLSNNLEFGGVEIDCSPKFLLKYVHYSMDVAFSSISAPTAPSSCCICSTLLL